MIKSGQSLTVLFSTANPATGAATDATGTPTGTLYVDGTADAATVTVTNITTGLYKAAVTLPTLSAGAVVSLRISATVSGVAGLSVVFQGTADTKRVSDLADASAAAVASQVRTELTTELGRIDAAVSSRLASASYSAPPSAATVAAAVEAAILNEGDATALLAAIAAKVEEFLNNDGDAEATLTAIATAVRTELATELGRIDATVSSRLATASYSAPPSAATVASQVRTELGTELGRIDAAVSSRLATAGYSAPPSAVAVASQVRTELTTELDEIGEILVDTGTTLPAAIAGIEAGAGSGAYVVAIAVVDGDEAAIEGATVRLSVGLSTYVGTTDADGEVSFSLDAATYSVAITASGYSFAPTTLVVTGATTRTYEMAGIVIPSAPADASLCRVYGYFETVDNVAAAGVQIVFELVAPDPSKSNKILTNRRRVCTTDSQGRLSDGTNAYVDLQRTDSITPAGPLWRVIAPRTVKWTGDDTFELEAATFDLASLIS